MSESNNPRFFKPGDDAGNDDSLDIHSILFGGAISKSEDHDDSSNGLRLSFESVAGLVELTATEMHEMPSFLQKSILQKGKEFFRRTRDESNDLD